MTIERPAYRPPARRVPPLSEWRDGETGDRFRVLLLVEEAGTGRPFVVYCPLDADPDPRHPAPLCRPAEEFTAGLTLVAEAVPGSSMGVDVAADGSGRAVADGPVDVVEPRGGRTRRVTRVVRPAARLCEGVRNPYLSRFSSLPPLLIPDVPEEIRRVPSLGRLVDRVASIATSRLVAPVRLPLVQRYAWAVPNLAALEMVRYASPRGVVEVGSGTGYWAMMLRQVGVDTMAFDDRSGYFPDYRFGRWYQVYNEQPDVVRMYRSRTLLMCWPPNRDGLEKRPCLALDTLRHYGGDTLVYVGEPRGGVTATDEFFDEVESPRWTAAARVPIPQWPGIHDGMTVYTRRIA